MNPCSQTTHRLRHPLLPLARLEQRERQHLFWNRRTPFPEALAVENVVQQSEVDVALPFYPRISTDTTPKNEIQHISCGRDIAPRAYAHTAEVRDGLQIAPIGLRLPFT